MAFGRDQRQLDLSALQQNSLTGGLLLLKQDLVFLQGEAARVLDDAVKLIRVEIAKQHPFGAGAVRLLRCQALSVGCAS
jgi:hypothetical protein